jgi:hypothetical protein
MAMAGCCIGGRGGLSGGGSSCLSAAAWTSVASLLPRRLRLDARGRRYAEEGEDPSVSFVLVRIFIF